MKVNNRRKKITQIEIDTVGKEVFSFEEIKTAIEKSTKKLTSGEKAEIWNKIIENLK
jgi:hypothetical protein